MKLPDKFVYISGISFEECTVLCSRNCSCTAYAYTNSTSLLPPQCLLWMGELIDTAKLGENGINFGKSKWRIMEIVLPVVSSLLMLLCLWLVWICNCKGKQENWEISKRQMQRALSVSEGLGGNKGFGNFYKGTLEGGTEIAVKRLSKSSGQGLEEFRMK
ncbi:G-type lectin S-receptor-like serine/threonine-protein kinase At1g61370 [Oryza glaberrima]|uniref:G-type lectin S-receptor-like serine/threonine-protein kinase At1g61370 n=1 Tax=Oryza glaberrima TaxID=4538 RepID=UPI00224C14D1|nr:G-type lectin S-receptor-like serine/threonine-protein kinase At1g61370 [Oryza glaberrima]